MVERQQSRTLVGLQGALMKRGAAYRPGRVPAPSSKLLLLRGSQHGLGQGSKYFSVLHVSWHLLHLQAGLMLK